MMSKLQKIIAVIALLGFLILISAVAVADLRQNKEEKQSADFLQVEIYPNADYWAIMDLSDTLFPTKEACEQLAENYLTEIAKLLHMEGWWKAENPNATVLELNLQIGSTAQSFTFTTATKSSETAVSGSILLSSRIAKNGNKDAAFAHELTHLIGFLNENSFSLSLTEGLCDYVQAEVGYNLYGELDIQELTAYMLRADFEKEEIKQTEEAIIEKIGIADSGYPYGQGGELSFWYTMSHSFVRYLIQEYGIDAVKELILEGEGEASYETYLGKNLVQLREEWMKELFTMELSITEEDILKLSEEGPR